MPSQEFAAKPESVAAIRRFIRQTVQDPDVLLVASELSSNVIRHARTDFTVSIEVGDLVRLEVSDGSSVLPAVKDLVEGDTSGGGGLRVLDRLTESWGVEATDTGKTVWAEWAGSETS